MMVRISLSPAVVMPMIINWLFMQHTECQPLGFAPSHLFPDQVRIPQTSNRLNTPSGSPTQPDPLATPLDGINMADSFFLNRIRQGDADALTRLGELRETVDTPLNLLHNFFEAFSRPDPHQRTGLFSLFHNLAVARGMMPNTLAVGRANEPPSDRQTMTSNTNRNAGLRPTSGFTNRNADNTIFNPNTNIPQGSIPSRVLNRQMTNNLQSEAILPASVEVVDSSEVHIATNRIPQNSGRRPDVQESLGNSGGLTGFHANGRIRIPIPVITSSGDQANGLRPHTRWNNQVASVGNVLRTANEAVVPNNANLPTSFERVRNNNRLPDTTLSDFQNRTHPVTAMNSQNDVNLLNEDSGINGSRRLDTSGSGFQNIMQTDSRTVEQTNANMFNDNRVRNSNVQLDSTLNGFQNRILAPNWMSTESNVGTVRVEERNRFSSQDASRRFDPNRVIIPIVNNQPNPTQDFPIVETASGSGIRNINGLSQNMNADFNFDNRNVPLGNEILNSGPIETLPGSNMGDNQTVSRHSSVNLGGNAGSALTNADTSIVIGQDLVLDPNLSNMNIGSSRIGFQPRPDDSGIRINTMHVRDRNPTSIGNRTPEQQSELQDPSKIAIDSNVGGAVLNAMVAFQGQSERRNIGGLFTPPSSERGRGLSLVPPSDTRRRSFVIERPLQTRDQNLQSNIATTNLNDNLRGTMQPVITVDGTMVPADRRMESMSSIHETNRRPNTGSFNLSSTNSQINSQFPRSSIGGSSISSGNDVTHTTTAHEQSTIDFILQKVGHIELEPADHVLQFVGDMNLTLAEPEYNIQVVGDLDRGPRRQFVMEVSVNGSRSNSALFQEIGKNDNVSGEKIRVHGNGEVRLVTRERVVIERIGFVKMNPGNPQGQVKLPKSDRSSPSDKIISVLRIESLNHAKDNGGIIFLGNETNIRVNDQSNETVVQFVGDVVDLSEVPYDNLVNLSASENAELLVKTRMSSDGSSTVQNGDLLNTPIPSKHHNVVSNFNPINALEANMTPISRDSNLNSNRTFIPEMTLLLNSSVPISTRNDVSAPVLNEAMSSTVRRQTIGEGDSKSLLSVLLKPIGRIFTHVGTKEDFVNHQTING